MDSLAEDLYRFGEDDKSGSLELTLDALKILRRFFQETRSDKWEEEFYGVASALVKGQPSMAAVFNIVNRVGKTVEAVIDGVERVNLTSYIERLIEEQEFSLQSIVSRAFHLLKGQKRIATYSRSSIVEKALFTLGQNVSGLRVFLSEARPGGEGITLAENLARRNIKVKFVVDMALPTLLRQVDCLLLGADAISTESFLNKTGTSNLCAQAVQFGVPVYVLAGKGKFIPGEMAKRLRIIERPPDEVWKPMISGIEVINRLFEWTDNILVTSFLTEDEILTPAQVKKINSKQDISRFLQPIFH